MTGSTDRKDEAMTRGVTKQEGLKLRRETLRVLTASELRLVVGARGCPVSSK